MAEQRRRPAGAQRAPGTSTSRRPAAGRPAAARPTPRAAARPKPRAAARPTARRRRVPVRWLAPLLAVAAGGLVAASQLAPVLVDLTATSSAIPDNGVTSGSSAATALGDGLLSWTTGPVAGDSNGASVIDSDVRSGLAVPQPPRPGDITLQPWAAHGVSPTLTPLEPACGGYSSPKRVTPGVVVGAGSATLSWQSDNRDEVQGYRVQAVSQDLVTGPQPVPVAQTVGQPDGCVPVSATLTGLTPGGTYVFWLEEEVTSVTTSGTHLDQIGTSEAVVIG